jgi:DNA-binding PadR family transcriptional regulator
MARENKSKYAIMGILSVSPASGYDIKKRIEKGVGYFWHEGYGQIYPILKQLVEDGLATKLVQEQEGKPDRIVYTLTEKGQADLKKWLSEPVEPQVERSEILLKLFFGDQVPIPTTVKHVQHFRQLQVQRLQRCKEIEREIKADLHHHPNQPYWLMTASYSIHSSQSLIAWCDETLARLAEPNRDPIPNPVKAPDLIPLEFSLSYHPDEQLQEQRI